jgi:DNA-directed RNA polymerase specialized sigma24 family protein
MDSGWTLSGAAFEGLLAILADDRDRAAAAYGELRQRIAGLLRWWGALDPDRLADLTLDRAARKLQEGASVERGDFGAYVRGVARMVFYESSRQPAPLPLDRDPAVEVEATDESAMRALDQCLDTLSSEDRRLVLRYYDGANQIAVRQQLARELGITPTALRLRTHRLRNRLEACVTSRVRQS